MFINIDQPILRSKVKQNTDLWMMEPEKDDAYRRKLMEETVQGQQEFINCPQMPIYQEDRRATTRETATNICFSHLGRLGFFIPDILPAEYEDALLDKEFIIALLPKDWKKVPSKVICTETFILDEKERKRITVTFISNSVEYRAKYHIEPRFNISTNYNEYIEPKSCDNWLPTLSATVIDSEGTVIYKTESCEYPSTLTGFVNMTAELRINAIKWLTEQYPEWKNPFAYWD
jgi:hypothetical protein